MMVGDHDPLDVLDAYDFGHDEVDYEWIYNSDNVPPEQQDAVAAMAERMQAHQQEGPT